MPRLSLLACNAGRYFSDEMLLTLQEIHPPERFRLVQSRELTFANGEIKTVIDDCIRGDDLYIVQCIENSAAAGSINDKLISLITSIDAAKRSDAAAITVVVLPFPYARQEKQGGREPITASVFAHWFEELGVRKVMALDVHADATAGFFRKATFFNLHASHTLMRYFKKTFSPELHNLVVVSPDAGGVKRAKFFAKTMRVPLALVYKERDYSAVNVIEKTTLLGTVADKQVLIVDDLIDTAGTLQSVVALLKEHGAREIYFACSHALLHGPALERVDRLYRDGMLHALIATNTVYRDASFVQQHPWYHSVSIAPFFAKVIKNINEGRSAVEIIDKEYAADFS